MKLLNCLLCDDIIKITKDRRYCQCRESSAKKITEHKIEYDGISRILGVSDSYYRRTKRTVDAEGGHYQGDPSIHCKMFVIPEDSAKIKKVEV